MTLPLIAAIVIAAVGVGAYFLLRGKSHPAPVIAPPPQIWRIIGSYDGQPVTVTASSFHGGAISSLTWAGTEFIDTGDNGRELQTAFTLDVPGEVENPTEAGAGSDGPTFSTTVIIAARDDDNVIRTQQQLAYWHPYNGQALSPHKLSKTVTLTGNVLHHQITITLANDVQAINMEGLTVYSPASFTRFFQYDLASGAVTEMAPHDMIYDLPNPTIIANADLSRAIALYGPGKLYHWGALVVPKLVCSAYQDGPTKAGDYSWDAYTVFGTFDQVRTSLGKLSVMS